MGRSVIPSSIANFHRVMALRRSLDILTDDRPRSLREESQLETDVPSIVAGVMPAASIFPAVRRKLAAYPRLASFPFKY
jgi:hypothetical protein